MTLMATNIRDSPHVPLNMVNLLTTEHIKSVVHCLCGEPMRGLVARDDYGPAHVYYRTEHTCVLVLKGQSLSYLWYPAARHLPILLETDLLRRWASIPSLKTNLYFMQAQLEVNRILD